MLSILNIADMLCGMVWYAVWYGC